MRQVALVTGGAVRVGRALTLGLAEAGYDVVLTWHRSEGGAREVSRRVRAMGRRVLAVPVDVSVAGDVERLAQEVEREYGRLDLLVNNASIFPPRAFLDIEEREWDQVMAVNLKGPFLVVKALAPLLLRHEGSVINIVDLSAFQPFSGYPHHSVSKAGLLHLTRVMAKALAPRVRVNAIAPGTVLPPEDERGEQDRRRERDVARLGTLGSPEDVVRTALFLAGSPFLTGEVIVLDGGESLGPR